jgi:hypothetical protein
MTTRKAKKANEPKTVVANDPEDRKGALKTIGGSQSDNWNNTLALQAVRSLWTKHSSEEDENRQLTATVAALQGVGPKDELEGMMAAQLLAAHNAAMECYRRAMIGEQTFEGRRENLNQANKLSRTWATLLDALNKHRGNLHDTGSDDQRRQFLAEFQSEFVLISYWLNRLRVTGTELSVASSPPENCDLCNVDLAQNGIFIFHLLEINHRLPAGPLQRFC